jgi:transcriptional regulator with XRE-family HTH domain
MRPTDLDLLIWLRQSLHNGRAREIREAARLRQAEIADVVGVSPDAIGLWERGLRSPGQPWAVRYARLLERLEHGIQASDGHR